MERNNIPLSFAGVRTQSVTERVDLVTIANLKNVSDPVPDWGGADLDELADRIVTARRAGHPVIWSQGAHVIKCGLSRYVIALIQMGVITHLSGNGACSIHDFELCFHGGTSEDVPTAIEDGTFGMWEETGKLMNEAIRNGAAAGRGYGESLAVAVKENPNRFPHQDDCLFYQAHLAGIPATYHIALGTDIIHQHPSVDFAAIGATSGTDFRVLCHSVCELEDGVFLNFGSGVIGPEVFLKALSIARNLGHSTKHITTANFDIREIAPIHTRLSYADPDYYYRPRKNIVIRPTSRGGWGRHFCADHQVSIPNLYRRIVKRIRNEAAIRKAMPAPSNLRY